MKLFFVLLELTIFAVTFLAAFYLITKGWKALTVKDKVEELQSYSELEKDTKEVNKVVALKRKKKVDDFLK